MANPSADNWSTNARVLIIYTVKMIIFIIFILSPLERKHSPLNESPLCFLAVTAGSDAPIQNYRNQSQIAEI